MSIREECGVFGVIAPEPADVAGITYYGLYALQHRGQESCGIVVNDDGLFCSHKDMGLVGEVFSPDVLKRMPEGTMAVGHVRYGTTGETNRKNCQPLEIDHQKGRMALAHNGNISNAAELRSALELTGAIFHTTSDTEIIAYIVTRERLKCASIEDALSAAMGVLDGAYSLVLMSPQKLICARDPYGFRPLCYGKTADAVSKVSCPQVRVFPAEHEKFRVAAIDCGMKKSMIDSMNRRGLTVTVVPWNTTAEAIEDMRPDGIFVSNGPGDPADVPQTIETVRRLIGEYPMFGVCLGHQIISLACGAKTYKLKFGHRGGNHPVKDLATGKIEITSQNHSYAVDEKSLEGTRLVATHINLLDYTVEGVRCEADRVFSVQYHPESAPGPRDSEYLFDRFEAMMEGEGNDA